MPLVVVCGLPCSGKTRRALQLEAALLQLQLRAGPSGLEGRSVAVVPDTASVSGGRDLVYGDSSKEKEMRGALKSEVERKINKQDVVIVDSLNYIKGCRYELYCIIKHAQTPHCLIHCDTAAQTCSEWNQQRSAEERYTQEVFDALVMRFEAPDSRNRWDSPLITVQPLDAFPLEAVCDALFHRKAPVQNQATLNQPLSSTNFLYELDQVTQEVVTAVLSAQKTSVPGDLITIPGAKDKMEMGRSVSMAELRRLRRQFISYTKMHPTENIGHISNMFVQYINKSTK
ncbi:protein KTI12 homolog [Lethenteron reissneri]|uniref:protein KTI12 homolog n=1 Tax=Lethenteron reissneri TaxID=7753 RepID=UPI002AB7D0C3|nr:protein KTI12 homolog [Lethenteron reissneri]